MLLVKRAIVAIAITVGTWCAASCHHGDAPKPDPRQLLAAYIREGFGQARTINECQPQPYGIVQDDSDLLDNGEIGYRISTGILCGDSRPA